MYIPNFCCTFAASKVRGNDDHEPVHVHVIKDQKHEAKFCVEPEVNLIENNGLKASELRLAESVIEENKEIIVNRWNEYFKN